MSIAHTCSCGAFIRLPRTAAGRMARCKTCGTIFKIPERARNPVPPAPDFSWPDQDTPIDDAPEPPVPLPADAAREDGDWIAPRRSFWGDLAGSFLFFLDPGNMVVFVVLAFACIFVEFVPKFGIFGLLLSFGFASYISAFLMAIVLETASGEDELPSLGITNAWDDLLIPAVQFAGTWLFVLLPAIVLAVWSWARTGEVVWNWVYAVGGAGLFFWPAVVLAVAVGGTFAGLWPHVVVRTALSAPVAYLAICAALLVAAAIAALPDVLIATGAAQPIASAPALALRAAGEAVGLYAAIVAMRVIGLFYRHYKHRLPWVAE